MTDQEMHQEAAAVAVYEAKRFGIPYEQAYINALRGFQAVQKGYRGIELVEPRK